MSDLVPWSGGVVSRDTRRAARSISRYQAGSQVRLALVDVDADLAAAKIDAVTSTTGQAMGAVVRVAQAQRHLEQMAPEAAGRLALLAEDHTWSMTDVMADLRRDLRRR